jgi:hypothetical protein
MKVIWRLLFSLLLILSFAVPAYADIIWPSFILEQHLLSIYPIILGLIVEYLFLRYYFKMNIKRAILADLAMNAASVCIGIILIPLSGLAWGYFPGLIFGNLFGMRNMEEWIVTFLMATFINAGIESFVVQRGFKVTVGVKGFIILSVANAISVGIAMASIPTFSLEKYLAL